MPVIKSGTLATRDLKGEEHGATISLILDQSEPGQGPRLQQHPRQRDLGCDPGNGR
jgi:hypothetical protein